MRVAGLLPVFLLVSACVLDRTVQVGGNGGDGGGGAGGGGGSGNTGGGGAGPDCGDGMIQGTEECDGSVPNGVTCESKGFVGGGLACTPLCGLDTQGCFSCGDGVKNFTDTCDGMDLGGATCQTAVMGSPGGTLGCKQNCTGFDTSQCDPAVTCNNGMLDGNEDCDGALLGGATCVTEGYDGGSLGCNANCTFDTGPCFSCGDGAKNGAESCDGGDLGGGTCASLGFAGGMLSCNADCTFNPSSCTNCGNGTLQGGEPCDGANLNGQSCATQGFAGGTLTCNAACSGFVTAACNNCGNGTLDAGETCDDGNMASNDGCSSACAIEQPAGCNLTSFLLVNPGTITFNGDTTAGTGTSPDVDCTSGAVTSGKKVELAIKPTQAGFVTLTLKRPGTAFDSVLGVRTTCGDAGAASQIVCGDNFPADGGDVLSFEATANTVYYVIVDGYDAAEFGAFALDIDLSAGTCADPVPVTLYEGEPMEFIGNSNGNGNDSQGTCGGSNAPDVVYQVTRSPAGTVAADLTSGYDKSLYSRSQCAMTETACSDNGGNAAEALVAQAVDSVNPTFFWVDGHNNANQNGAYVLTLTP